MAKIKHTLLAPALSFALVFLLAPFFSCKKSPTTETPKASEAPITVKVIDSVSGKALEGIPVILNNYVGSIIGGGSIHFVDSTHANQSGVATFERPSPGEGRFEVMVDQTTFFSGSGSITVPQNRAPILVDVIPLSSKEVVIHFGDSIRELNVFVGVEDRVEKNLPHIYKQSGQVETYKFAQNTKNTLQIFRIFEKSYKDTVIRVTPAIGDTSRIIINL
jgi:hypothetical protein